MSSFICYICDGCLVPAATHLPEFVSELDLGHIEMNICDLNDTYSYTQNMDENVATSWRWQIQAMFDGLEKYCLTFVQLSAVISDSESGLVFHAPLATHPAYWLRRCVCVCVCLSIGSTAMPPSIHPPIWPLFRTSIESLNDFRLVCLTFEPNQNPIERLTTKALSTPIQLSLFARHTAAIVQPSTCPTRTSDSIESQKILRIVNHVPSESFRRQPAARLSPPARIDPFPFKLVNWKRKIPI